MSTTTHAPDEGADDALEAAGTEARTDSGGRHIVINGDGKSKRAPSGDPEIDALWGKTLGELAAIEEDESHPLHEKAKLVGREMVAPLADALASSSSAMQAEWSRNLGHWASTALQPALSAMGQLQWQHEPGILRAGESLAEALAAQTYLEKQALAREAVSPYAAQVDFPYTARTVDLTADEAPNATAAEVHDAMQVAGNDLLKQMVEIQADQLTHMKGESDKSENREKSNRRILWGTLAAAVLTLVATVVLGLPGFIENVTP